MQSHNYTCKQIYSYIHASQIVINIANMLDFSLKSVEKTFTKLIGSIFVKNFPSIHI